jgi:two-component system cell cycle response regulator DivK
LLTIVNFCGGARIPRRISIQGRVWSVVSRRMTDRWDRTLGPQKPVVLVVDDDFDARTIYATYLKAVGCSVFVASDGRAALDKADELSPDIIIMDLAMPRLDGWEAIRRLRQSSWTREIAIIALSAVPSSRDTAFEAGCDAYLAKPCEPQLLWTQIQTLLRLPPAPADTSSV